ncbi:uncharacterized protein LOC133037085 [Cannabis sativa]|uniref:uncharacterized protein LOC133037085 n=1 Tax=Cannabis sativa TaxID=3483 RepID=UPI0029CA33D1|nr:uncharacterized protein LOC133037085 [Cannabis sativa]
MKLEADVLLEMEEVSNRLNDIWRQKSRELWLKDGDRNTRFFHTSTVIRRKRNFISAISEDDVHWISGRRDIGDYFTENFQQVFTSVNPPVDEELIGIIPPMVSSVMNDSLTSILSRDEIRRAVWSMGPLKAPGPDGMHGRFYRSHWEIVADDVIGTVSEFFQFGRFVKSLNRTFIVLIPKKEGAKKFDDFRPISLCNFTYKIISKILSNRLRGILPNLISPLQAAFVPGRWIAENGLIAQEIMHSFNRKCSGVGYVGMKLDMSKAYDRMEWGFLDRVIDAFGFCVKFHQLIAWCVSSVSFSVLLNGGPLKQFFPSRGLRQGDPLSPYLFILGVKSYHGYCFVRRSMELSMGVRANSGEVARVQDCLNKYCLWSGQLGFTPLSSEDKFLGNPLLFSRSKRNDFQFVVDRVKNRLEGWRSKLLSQAGRTTLINSVIASTPIYTMSTFLLPKTICSTLDKLARKFWWVGATGKNRFLALTSWDSICLPKSYGGLGIKKFFDLNMALISKLAWGLVSGSIALWCSVFHAKYCKRGDTFWNCPNPSPASFSALGIFSCRDFVRKESCWLTNDGGDIDLWCSPWIPWLSWDEYLAAFNPRIRDPQLNTLSPLLDDEGVLPRDVLNLWFIPEVAEKLGKFRFLGGLSRNVLVWRDSLDGRFSVKCAYRTLIKGRLPILNGIWKKIWGAPVHFRTKLFLWKVARNILPCGQKLHDVLGSASCCVLCGAEEDSLLHLFLHCGVARHCWLGSPWGIRSDLLSFSSPLEMVHWFFDPGISEPDSSFNSSLFLWFALFLCGVLWQARNKAFHEGIPACPSAILIQVQRLVAGAGESGLGNTVQPPIGDVVHQHGVVLPAHEFTVYCDAAVRGGTGFFAVVAFDSENTLVAAFSAKAPVSSPLEAETLALHHAVSFCSLRGWDTAVVFSNCQVLVDAVNKRVVPDWKLTHVFLSLFSEVSLGVCAGVFWIPRRNNEVAHRLAARAATLDVCRVFGVGEVAPLLQP